MFDSTSHDDHDLTPQERRTVRRITALIVAAAVALSLAIVATDRGAPRPESTGSTPTINNPVSR